MWEVLPHLYLGDRHDSCDRALLSRHGVTHVVNCAVGLPCVFPSELRYLSLELEDPDREFSRRVPAAMTFIDEGHASGAVLVHCGAGVSRSAAVVLSYLCHLGRPLHEACAELSRAVLTGIDELFLSQIAAAQSITLSKQQLKSLSLVLAGRGETAAE
jgi:protein tyrosine phosphatase